MERAKEAKMDIFSLRFVASALWMTVVSVGPASGTRIEDAMRDLAAKPRHHAMAQSSYVGNYHWVWGKPSRSQAEAEALDACRQREEARVRSACRIVFVDGRATGRLALNLDFPAEVEIYDGSTGRVTSSSGRVVVRNYYTNDGQFLLKLSNGREICSGNIQFTRGIAGVRIRIGGQCFDIEGSGQYELWRKQWRIDFGNSYVEVRRAF